MTTDAFAARLAGALLRDGRSLRAVAEGTGVTEWTLDQILLGHERASERTARQLAPFIGLLPHEASALAGHPNPSAGAANPRDHDSLDAWLRATLELRQEKIWHLAAESGIPESIFWGILKRRAYPERPTLDRLADHVGIDRAELRALRGKNPNKVAHGRRVAAKLEDLKPGRMREISSLASVRKRRGYQAADNGRTGAIVMLRRRSPEQSERFRKMGPIVSPLGVLWRRTRSSGDEVLKKRLRKRIRAEAHHLLGLKGRGRPPTSLVAHVELAIAITKLADDGRSTGEIAELMGRKVGRDQRGYKAGSRWVRDLLKLGRALKASPSSG